MSAIDRRQRRRVGRARGHRRTSYKISSGEGPVIRVGPQRDGRRINLAPPVTKLDPNEAIVGSGRVASKETIDSAYRYLDNRAENATTFRELDELKKRNEAVFARIRGTPWASVGEEEYKRCNAAIRKRYDKLREKESAIKIGAGASAGPGTVAGSGVFEKRTSKEPPPE